MQWILGVRVACSLAVFYSAVAQAQVTSVTSAKGNVAPSVMKLGSLQQNSQYSFLYSLQNLHALPQDARVTLELRQAGAPLLRKVLHAGDPDFYAQFRVSKSGPVELAVKPVAVSGPYLLQVNRWPLSTQVKSGPNHRWQDAMPFTLGKTVFASGDEMAYIPLPGTPRMDIVENEASVDWYRFEFQDEKPKLVFFQIELTERDQVPVDVTIHRVVNGKLEAFYEGEDPVANPHEVQALPGNKFTPRLLKEKGTYYVSVRANHPEYKLRTRLYDPAPYTDPKQAVRTGVDYILAAGDSWHANTPRRGGILDRVSSAHQETSLCVACHVTHFPQRAQLYATRNGYPVVQRQQLQFLSERFYNNPRPFYGFEQQGATWARMISAAANVLGRMSHLMGVFEEQVSGETRPAFHKGIGKYLDIYYDGRTKLPSDETNGNTPLVSAHEVAWYAWTNTKAPSLPQQIAAGEVKNTIDLCYQTLALADVDRSAYKEQIQKNAERILSLQRPDGQWSARWDLKEPEVEFQTGHALWALHAAGIPATHPQVAKGLAYLLQRQQTFGGWMDPLQSFENFRTPFRETQMAVLALSSYYPQAGRVKGWNSPVVSRLSANPVELLEQLDNIWDAPSAEVRKQIEAAATSDDALIRQAAVEALGRVGVYSPVYVQALGDSSKMVQRTAAWALRQTYSRHTDTPAEALTGALQAKNDRTRWGASRVFAAHFASLAARPEIAKALLPLTDDAVISTRMNAVKGLWQFWFWTTDVPTKERIEDTLLAKLGSPQPEWVARNLSHAVYNLADENIRYFYNNWVPLLAHQEDRERAVMGRLAVEDRLSSKFAKVLESGPETQKKALLHALTEFPLRRADVYDLKADLSKTAPPVYNRIGNDIEQITFFGPSRERMAVAIAPLLESQDAEMRRLASQAVLLVREMRFADVNRLAGAAGPVSQQVVSKLDTVPEAVEVARAFKPPPPPAQPTTKTGTGKAIVTAKLDEAYFRGYVEPILQKRGKDGYACVQCHATHTLFDGNWSSVKNVVNVADPENSLLLQKPTSSAETEGIANSSATAHGGGIRFTKDSPEYAIILGWINGNKE